VVAIATADLSEIVVDGRTGVLVSSDRQLMEALRSLADSPTERHRMGVRAREKISSSHVTDVVFRDLAALVDDVVSGGVERRPLQVSVVSDWKSDPENQLAECLEAGLEANGHRVERLETEQFGGPEHGASAPIVVVSSGGCVPRTPPASSYRVVAGDDEALQHPMGPQLVSSAALHSGAKSTAALGPWLAGWIEARYGVATDMARYPVDEMVFQPHVGPRELAIAYNARWMELPADRDIGLQAVAKLAADVEGLVLEVYGTPEDPLSGLDLPLEYHWLGELSAPQRACLFSTASALLYTGLTNVPLDVLEAMAVRCPVVAVSAAASDWLLTDGWTAALAVPRADALAAALDKVLEVEPYRTRIADGAWLAVERHGRGQSEHDLSHWAECSARGGRSWDAAVELDAMEPDRGQWLAAAAEQSIWQPFPCSRPGLCRFDVLVAPRAAEAGVELALDIVAGSADGLLVRSSRATTDSAVGSGWLRFHFDPIPDSRGNWYWAGIARVEPESSSRLELACSSVGSSGSARETANGVSAAGRPTAIVDGIRSDRILAYRTYRRRDGLDMVREGGSDGPSIGPSPDLSPYLNSMSALDREIHELWTELETDRRTLPYRLAHAGDAALSPLPPVHERPWPADASATAKLWGTLRHYGPIALAREMASYFRWATMSADARERATRGDG
jgi:glycosyltransferase involved in cell wall biosynthesis